MSKSSSESLAAIIISNRVLGLFSEEAKSCMSELMRRREEDQDSFEFEKYIDEQIKIIENNNEKSKSGKEFTSLLSSFRSFL